MSNLRLVSFFAGAGGFDLGFQKAGYEIVKAYEWDKFAVESYKANIGNHIEMMDVSILKGEDIPESEVWTFGFPFQDVSVAGQKKGMIKGETRTGLFYEIMRLLGEVKEKPPVILAENVKGLKKFLPVVEEEFNLAGYRFTYTMYNSKYFGVPQSRERYFMVGIREDLDIEFTFPQQQTAFIPKLSTILETEVAENFYVDNEKAAKIIEQAQKRVEIVGNHPCITPDRLEKRQNGRRAKEDEEPMYTLTAQDMHGIIEPSINVIGMAEGINGHDLLKRVYDPEGLSPTLNTCGGGNTQPKILVAGSLKPDHATRFGNRDVVYDSDGIAGTVNASDWKQPRPVLHEFRVRKLVPREYARLQGFPEDYVQVVSNSQMYKQMGNAVTVPVAYEIAKAIKGMFL